MFKSSKTGQARKIVLDLQEKYGERASVTELVSFLVSSYVITPKALRDYEIIRYVEDRQEGQSKSSAMKDLEADGAEGVANGLTYDAIYKICKNADL